MIHGAVDQAQFLGPCGINERPRGQHFKRLFARDVAGQRHHRGGTKQTKVHAVHAEPRAMGGHGQITGGDQLATGGGGDAVGFGDDGLGQAGDRLHHAAATGEQIVEIGPPAVFGLSPLCHFLQVMASAEHLARAFQDHHLGLGIGGQRVELGLQGGQHRVRECIQALGGIQGQGGDAARVFAQ